MNITKLLLVNGLVNHTKLTRSEQSGNGFSGLALNKGASVATLVCNMAYFGYKPHVEVIHAMKACSDAVLGDFWNDLKSAMASVKKTDVGMEQFVVYKNFPQEVLSQTEQEYWDQQIKIYSGELAQEDAGEEVKERAELTVLESLAVLRLSEESSLELIYKKLVSKKSSWGEDEKNQIQVLSDCLQLSALNIADFGFKENAMQVFSAIVQDEKRRAETKLVIADATDVIRLAVALSGGNIQEWGTTRFKSFSRGIRRILMTLLEESKNLEQDVSQHQEVWKRFFAMLHPSDFKMLKVNYVYDKLYNGKIKTFASVVDLHLQSKNYDVFEYLAYRPGEFLRRFMAIYEVFGDSAVSTFIPIMKNLSVRQLLWFKRYITTLNTRKKMLYTPKGNWSKVQVSDNKRVIDAKSAELLCTKINETVSRKINQVYPQGFAVEPEMSDVKLASNGQYMSHYGRGTKFDIPENVKFFRLASYWQNDKHCWFDVGVNYFTEDWTAVGATCWNSTHLGKWSIFSGDPMNSSELKGRACQMIDIYPQQRPNNVRYGVWNILAYSNIAFSESTEVLGTLQWGEEAETGKLYEPSRAQLVFNLKNNSKTSYLAIIDFKENKLIYLDLGMKGNVSSAASNSAVLQANMPAVMEYLNAIPSVADLLEFNHSAEGVPVVYSDKNAVLKLKDKPAYVLRPENDKSEFVQINFDELLSL